MRLPVFLDANLIGQTPHGLRSYNVLDANNNLIKQLTVPFYLPTDRNNQTLSSYNTGFSVANTWYNSLAATVRRPFNNGLELLLNYTWAHASDTGQVQGNNGTFYGGDTPLDPNNVRLENGLSDIDIRNRFAGSLVYQSQIMKDNKFFKYGLNPFLFSGTMIASAGQPIFASMTGTVSGGAEGNIYGGAMSSSSGASTTGRPPQIGRNSQIGPGFNNIDFRLSRNVPIHESIYLQFSGDAFNLLNHKIVTGVNGSYSTYLHCERHQHHLQHKQLSSFRFDVRRLHHALQRHWPHGLWRCIGDQQRPLQRAAAPGLRQVVLLTPNRSKPKRPRLNPEAAFSYPARTTLLDKSGPREDPAIRTS